MGSDRQQRFSLRKYAVGLVSVLVGCFFCGVTVSAQEQEGQVDVPAIVVKEGSQEVSPTVGQGDGSDGAHTTDTVKEESSSQEKAKTEKTGEISPSNAQTNPVSDPTPEKEGVEKKEQEDHTVLASQPVANKDAVSASVADEARVQALVRLETKKQAEAAPLSIAEQIKDNAPIKEAVLNELKEKGIQYTKLADFDLVFNGFVLETKYKDALKIRQLARVEKVEITPLTTQTDAQPSSTKQNTLLPTKVSDENELINLQPLWGKGIKGQGRVVAVLDTGLDVNHNFFSLTDKSKAKYQNKEQMEAAMKKSGITYGKWYNDKVVYAYNYSDMNDEIREDDPRSHGTHVAGSAVGNATKPVPTGEYLKGVAPEAQLIFMRVFSDKKGMTEQGFVVAKAVEDAVKLGADTINMSFGGVNGSEADTNPLTRQAFEFARKSGVVINAAAGNYAVSGYWQAKPKADAPDTGTIDEPAIEDGVLAIGAFNNQINHETTMRLEIPALKDKKEFQNGLVDLPVYRLIFPVEGPQSYVSVPKGGLDGYRTATVKGKIALVESGGDVTDEEKVNALRQAGAKGVLVYQNEEQGDSLQKLPMGYWGSFYPVSVLNHAIGKELASHAGEYELIFHQEVKKVPYSEANKMLFFTGWGLSAEGKLKPDVTLPGGMVYSAIPDGLYDMDEGTSMATPHAAGATALIKQALEQRFPTYSPEQIHTLLRQLVMSTAKPHFDQESKSYSSVRQQGSGLMDAAAAAFGDVFVTGGKGTNSSLTLGNVKDTFTFEGTGHNLSSEAKDFTYHTVVNTDQVENNRISLKMRQLLDQVGEKIIHVPAKGSVTVPISVDTSTFTSELTNQMKNGYFLEGFVFFKDAKTKKDLVSLPYIGFKGKYQDLPGIEKPIYAFTGDEKPFYYYANEKAEKPEKDSGDHFTALVSTIWRGGKEVQVVLGEKDGHYDGNQLVFSPNDDGSYDSVKLNAVVLRNVDNIHLSVYRADDLKREHPIFEQGNESQKKSDYGWRINDRSKILYATQWAGKDNNNQLVPDGDYQYVVTYRPSTPGAKPQEIVLKVRVDKQVPQLANTKDLFDPATRLFKPGEIIETGSGLGGKYLSYKKDDQEVEISPNEDGTYSIPEGVDLKTVRFYIWDRVNNTNTLTLDGKTVSEEKTTEKSGTEEASPTATTSEATVGRLEVQIVDEKGEATNQYPEMMRYQVFDSKGNRVDQEFNSFYEDPLPTLPFGTYTIKVVSQDQNYSWVSPTTVTVELSKEHPEGLVKFVYHYIDKNRFDLVFDKELPDGTRVFAIDKKTGEKVELNQTLYEPKTFESILINGEYQIHIDLPTGYRAVENDFIYTVANRINRYLTSFVEVSEDQVEDPTVPPTPQLSPMTQKGRIKMDQEAQQVTPQPSPMTQKGQSEMDQEAQQVTHRPVTSLPKTGQESDQLGIVGFMVLLLTFGAIRMKKNHPDQV